MPTITPTPGVPRSAYEAAQMLGSRDAMSVARLTRMRRMGDGGIMLSYRHGTFATYERDGSVLLYTPSTIANDWYPGACGRMAAVLPDGWALLQAHSGLRPYAVYRERYAITIERGGMEFRPNGRLVTEGYTITRAELDEVASHDRVFVDARRRPAPRYRVPRYQRLTTAGNGGPWLTEEDFARIAGMATPPDVSTAPSLRADELARIYEEWRARPRPTIFDVVTHDPPDGMACIDPMCFDGLHAPCGCCEHSLGRPPAGDE